MMGSGKATCGNPQPAQYLFPCAIALPHAEQKRLSAAAAAAAGVRGATWTGIQALQPSPIFWGNLPVTCTVLLGLALDYDVFLFTRVAEFRFRGHSNRDSVQGALEASGPTITTAGIIMAIAFGALLWKKRP